MKNKRFIVTVIVFLMLIVYLFVTAPPPLHDKKTFGMQLPIEFVLRLADEENKIVRSLYTKEILQAGKKIGIKFDEDWQNKSVTAGLLPAQFLRETAMYLEKSPVRLGLYLGSDYPINKANLLEDLQLDKFNKIKHDRSEEFFKIDLEETFVFMSPDVAVVTACVSCHNKHSQSPKTDWKLNDVMGATTWLYPEKTISLNDALNMLSELRNGFKFSYQYFLNEVKQMPKSYLISNKWPREGNFVPTVDVFMEEVSKRASHSTFNKLLNYVAESK